MKRSKIFLGITTSILAVAGVAATKYGNTIIKGYYITATNNVFCTYHARTLCTQPGLSQCTYTVGIFPNQHGYKVYTNVLCTTPLTYDFL